MSDNVVIMKSQTGEQALVSHLQCWELPAWTLTFIANVFDPAAPAAPEIRGSVRAHYLLQLSAALLDIREDESLLPDTDLQIAIRRLSSHVRNVAVPPVCGAVG